MANANKTTITAEPGKQEMLITREFDAPRELVFQAFTDPELYVQWLGPRRLTMTLETFEPRSGGRWRYIHKDQSGNEFASSITWAHLLSTWNTSGRLRHREQPISRSES